MRQWLMNMLGVKEYNPETDEAVQYLRSVQDSARRGREEATEFRTTGNFIIDQMIRQRPPDHGWPNREESPHGREG